MQTQPKQIFFVGGQGKSGTTWLEHLLDAHPDISCRGEAHFGDALIPLLKNAYLEYQSILEANNAVFPELTGYDAGGVTAARNAARAWIATCLEKQASNASVKAIGERTPANIECAEELVGVFPFCRVIHMIRDPRDITVSLWYHGLRTNPQAFSEKYKSITHLAKEVVATWPSGIRSAREFGKTIDDRYTEVRYEDLHDSPAEILNSLFRFIGVDGSKDIAESCIDAASFLRVTGREIGNEDRSSHYRKGVVGDWQNHLDDDAQSLFTDQARDLLDDLGYKLRAD